MKVAELFENKQFVDCPKCGGNPEYDESGLPYTCFFCSNTGFVPARQAQQYEDDMSSGPHPDSYGSTNNNYHDEQEEWDVKHTGENTNKSIAQLRHEEANARKRHDTKAIRQKNFAIQAKSHWSH